MKAKIEKSTILGLLLAISVSMNLGLIIANYNTSPFVKNVHESKIVSPPPPMLLSSPPPPPVKDQHKKKGALPVATSVPPPPSGSPPLPPIHKK